MNDQLDLPKEPKSSPMRLPLLAAQYALLPVACERLFAFFIMLFSGNTVRGELLYYPETLYYYALPAWLMSLGVLRFARGPERRGLRIGWQIFLFLLFGFYMPNE